MHSVAPVSGNPNSLIAAFRRAGSPKPNTRVRKTENDTRSAERNTESGAILRQLCVYFLGEEVCITDGVVVVVVLGGSGVTARPPKKSSGRILRNEGWGYGVIM